jgi:hypothetical protein
MGTWRFFVDGAEIPLTLSELQASGRFKVTVPAGLSSVLFPQLPPASTFPMSGQGLWNETGQEISFTLSGQGMITSATLVFAGIQVRPRTGDPGQDLTWTLVGHYRHALAAPAAQPIDLVADESARRPVFGRYAQMNQVL